MNSGLKLPRPANTICCRGFGAAASCRSSGGELRRAWKSSMKVVEQDE